MALEKPLHIMNSRNFCSTWRYIFLYICQNKKLTLHNEILAVHCYLVSLNKLSFTQNGLSTYKKQVPHENNHWTVKSSNVHCTSFKSCKPFNHPLVYLWTPYSVSALLLPLPVLLCQAERKFLFNTENSKWLSSGGFSTMNEGMAEKFQVQIKSMSSVMPVTHDAIMIPVSLVSIVIKSLTTYVPKAYRHML